MSPISSSLQRLGNHIFLLTPYGVHVSPIFPHSRGKEVIFFFFNKNILVWTPPGFSKNLPGFQGPYFPRLSRLGPRDYLKRSLGVPRPHICTKIFEFRSLCHRPSVLTPPMGSIMCVMRFSCFLPEIYVFVKAIYVFWL